MFKIINILMSLLNIKFNLVKELPKFIFEFIGILSIVFIFYFYFISGNNISDTIQILTVYLAASFRVLPSINKILNNAQVMKFCSSAVINLYNETKNFKFSLYIE